MRKFIVGYFNDFEETYDVKVVEGEEEQIKALVDKYNDDSYNTEFFYEEYDEVVGIDMLEKFFKEAEDEDEDDEEEYACDGLHDSVYEIRYNSKDKKTREPNHEEGSPFIEKKRKSILEIILKFIDTIRLVVVFLIIIALGAGIVNWICGKF